MVGFLLILSPTIFWIAKLLALETIEIELMLFATCICLSYSNIRNFDWESNYISFFLKHKNNYEL